MIRALRVVMIVYGAILLLMGLGAIIIPYQMAELFRFEATTDDIIVLSAITGLFGISAGVWVIVAGRDPLRNIYLVKLLITLSILLLVVNVYSSIQGYIDFSEVVPNIIVDAVFAVVLLALYPWHAARIGE